MTKRRRLLASIIDSLAVYAIVVVVLGGNAPTHFAVGALVGIVIPAMNVPATGTFRDRLWWLIAPMSGAIAVALGYLVEMHSWRY